MVLRHVAERCRGGTSFRCHGLVAAKQTMSSRGGEQVTGDGEREGRKEGGRGWRVKRRVIKMPKSGDSL